MRRKLLFALIVVLVGWLSPGTAQAQAPAEPLHILLVIDDSGSMGENDGQNLRVVAAKLFISLLEPQDQVAVIRFSTESQVAAPFTPMDPDSKRDLIARLDHSFYSDGGTDIRAALGWARRLMAEAPAGQGRVVFMTDGLPYIADWQSRDPTPEELEAYIEETVAIAEEIGKPVLTVALGDKVDRPFLQEISRVSQGRYFEAATALDLPAVYLEMLSELQDRAVVGPGRLTAPGETVVDVHLYAQSVGFVVVKDPQVTAALYSPGTSEPLDLAMSGVVALREPQFDVIVVPDLSPGPWRIALSGAGQADVKAIVINSRLQLELAAPVHGAACAGQPWLISARLRLAQRDGSLMPITGADAPGDLGAEVTRPDGQVQTLTLRDEANAGEFAAFFDETGQPGTYRIVLRTDVGGLDARHTAEVTARACPGLTVVAPCDGGTTDLATDQALAVEVHLTGGEGQPLDEGTVLAVVMDADGSQVTLPLTNAGQGHYQGEFRPVVSGTHEIQASLEGAVWRGLPVEAQAGPMRVTVRLIPPDPWKRYRAWLWAAAAALGVLEMLLLKRWARRPRLDGELVYGPPGGRPDYEAVRGRAAYFRVEDGYLAARRRRRGAHAMLRAERDGEVRLLPLDGVRLTKNNVPVQQEGSLVGPRDVIRLRGLEIRFENYRQK
jgi:hypothetical protein